MKSRFYQRKASVLIITKDDDNANTLVDILSPHFEVMTAFSGEVALDVLHMNYPKTSLIIIDGSINNGKNCFLQIKQDDELSKVPVIVTITQETIDEAESWIEAGVNDYVLRPYHPKLLVERINNVVRLRETSSFLEALEKDELTGLFTRQAFIHNAKYYITRSSESSFCILGFDIENFKLTNTQYGEEKCNEFLAYVGRRLISRVHSGIAGRFSGDQFVVLFEMTEEATPEIIHEYVSEILDSAPIPNQIVKVGVYQDIDTSLSVVRCCDRVFLAIREIKGVYGKDLIIYEDRFQQKLLDEQRIVEGMEKALEEEQFQIYYQPKHESITGKIAGAEALIRWIHPEYGFMAPNQFIPLFEKNGFINKIDSFVIKKVCKDIIKWQNEGIPIVPVSINISRRDFFEPGWMDRQVEIIDEFGIDHCLIHMEVTESMYSENIDLIIAQVKKVQDAGFLIEMDDFGAGYSSLGMLATFPLDIIKLDISFVRHIDVNVIIVENIIKMAHRMGFITVAEGAESNEEFKILKDLGCDLIQGYIFSRPLCGKDFAEYLKHNACSLEPIVTQVSLSSVPEFNDKLFMAANEVAEGVPGGFFSYHADGNREIINFNQEILHIYECENSEDFRTFTNNSFDGMVHEADLQRVLAKIERSVSDNIFLSNIEHRIECKDGSVKYVRSFGRYVATEAIGNIFYVFMNDCTEEHNKRIEEQKKAEVIQGISQTYSYIFLLDCETKKIIPYAINEENSAQSIKEMDMLDDYEKMSEVYLEKYVAADDVALMSKITSLAYIKRELKKSNYFNFTFHLKKPLGGVDLVEMGFRKINNESEIKRVVITFRPIAGQIVKSENERNIILIDEIDQQRQIEEDYKEDLQKVIKKAETAEKAKRAYTGNIVDSLLASLNKLTECLDSIEENINDKSRLLNYVERGNKVKERMSYTVNSMMKLANMENTRIKVNEIPTDISMAMEKTKNLVESEAVAKNMCLMTFMEVQNPYLYQDISLTAEFVGEILSNAIKYTPKGGKIRLGIRQLPCESPEECIIEFSCEDTGIGMSKEFLPHVFERYTREDNEINRLTPAAGVGLTIAGFIVEVMNGSIEIESELGKGTKVIVQTRHKFANKDDVEKNSSLISGVLKK